MIYIIWSASDNMAIAALEAAQKKGLVAGKNLFVGGIDWTLRALEQKRKNKLSATIGGHLLEAAWAVILFYDYINNPARRNKLSKINKTIMQDALPQNIPKLKRLFYGDNKGFNFRNIYNQNSSNIEKIFSLKLIPHY